ncbi:MAG: hypothetical protein AB8B46_00770 [Candidatus Midichloriaceae bacterium]
MVNVNTLEKSYEEGYALDGTEHKIFDAVPKAIDKLKETFLTRSRVDSEDDAQRDLGRDELVIYENGEEIAIINDIEQIKELEYLTGEQKDFILMHFQLFEGSLSGHLRNDYSESKDFNFGETLGKNGCYNSLAIERGDGGEVKGVMYNRKRVYGYGRDPEIAKRLMDSENIDQVYMSVEHNITSLKADKMTESTILPKFKLTVSAIDHAGLNGSEIIFPKSGVDINKTGHRSLKSFLIDCFIDKIKNNQDDKAISDLFYETFSVLATDPKSLKILKNEATKVEREILLQNGELKSTEKIRHYLNRLIELIFGTDQFLSTAQHSKMSSFVTHVSDQGVHGGIKGR